MTYCNCDILQHEKNVMHYTIHNQVCLIVRRPRYEWVFLGIWGTENMLTLTKTWSSTINIGLLFLWYPFVRLSRDKLYTLSTTKIFNSEKGLARYKWESSLEFEGGKRDLRKSAPKHLNGLVPAHALLLPLNRCALPILWEFSRYT